MEVEASFKPSLDEVTLRRPFLSRDFLDSEVAIVGLAVERDEEGYAARVDYSDGRAYTFSSASDVLNWLSLDEPYLVRFVRGGQREFDAILKWFGPKVFLSAEGSYLPALGFKVSLGELKVSFRPNAFSVYGKRNRRLSSTYCLAPFYHMSYLLPDDIDCFGVQYFARRLVDGMLKHSVPFSDLKGPGSVFQSILVDSGVRFGLSTAPPEATALALDCYHTNWLEAFALGHFDDTYDYDVTSAYPYQVSQLVSPAATYGTWVQSRKHVGGAAYGFLRAVVRIPPEVPLSPIMFRNSCSWDGYRRTRQANVWGEWTGAILAEEEEFIRDRGLGKVEVLDGWWFVPDVVLYPFRAPMAKLFTLRDEAGADKAMATLFKVVAATSQGKFISTYYDRGVVQGGALYEPIFAAAIVGRTRLAVADFCLSYAEDVLRVAIDGVLMGRRVPASGNKKPGSMRLAAQGESIVLGDGEHWMPGRCVGDYIPDALGASQSEAGYYRPVKGYYSLGEGIKGDFELVGRPKKPFVWVSLASLGRAQRLFPNVPRVSGDLLSNQYHSVMRSVDSVRGSSVCIA